MSGLVPPAALGLAVAVLVGAAMACAQLAVREPAPRDASRRPGGSPWWPGHERAVAAVVVATLVLFATQLVVVAVVAGAGVAWWRRLLRDDRAAEERLRVEGIASWLEDLRDTLRGSAIGVEEALEEVARRPPDALREPLAAFAHRRRQGVRTDDALGELADAIAHPTADAAVAALRLVVTGSTGAARLHPTVGTLAAAARDEVRARERVDRTRAVYVASMQRLVVIAALLVAYLRFGAGDLLDPYRTPLGQVFLALPVAMWAGCIAWLRSLCRYEVPARYRIAGTAPLGPAAVGAA